MPTYDFVCINCDAAAEMHFAFDAIHRPKCEVCGMSMVKAYTPPSVQFKGGGWGGQ